MNFTPKRTYAETYTGRPCKNGHPTGLRYKSTNSCVECAKAAANRQRVKASFGAVPA